jgi:hypothetical protein
VLCKPTLYLLLGLLRWSRCSTQTRYERSVFIRNIISDIKSLYVCTERVSHVSNTVSTFVISDIWVRWLPVPKLGPAVNWNTDGLLRDTGKDSFSLSLTTEAQRIIADGRRLARDFSAFICRENFKCNFCWEVPLQTACSWENVFWKLMGRGLT